MRNGKVILLLMGLLLLESKAISAENSSIKWLEPIYIHDSSYQVSDFIPNKDGFQIFIAGSKNRTSWHIQVRSDNSMELSKMPYIIKFKARSNNKFALYSRLGEANVNDGNSYVDRQWQIIGDGEWHTYSLEFLGKDITNYLYFQVGKAPSGTRFEIGDISLKPLER